MTRRRHCVCQPLFVVRETCIIRGVTPLPERLSPIIAGRRRVFCCHSATLSTNFAPNSLAAVRECVDAGVPRLEIDVQFLADDGMLIFHDGSFELPGGSRPRIADSTRAQAADVRHTDGSALCYLEDVVLALQGSPTVLQVDLKLSRPITARRAELLEAALQPISGHVLAGSQAHWNLRALKSVPIALDPTLHWVYSKASPGIPRNLGIHGLWDDSPIASNGRFSARQYLEVRVDDLLALLPNAVEWMVDIETLFKIEDLGMRLGDHLRERGVALAAWTLRENRPERAETLRRLFSLGAETIITDIPEAAAAAVL